MSPGIDALDDYHLLRPIGTGGMGSVWLAVDARSGREVALKRMLPRVAHDRELRHAFTDEATLGLRLRHPNIVETIELGSITTSKGTEPYLVLELLRGRPLVELLRASARLARPIPLAVAMQIVTEVARGLHYAHQLTDDEGAPLAVVHRDVSPHNIFVCDDGVAKVFDFGVATAKRQIHHSRSGAIKGKLEYLAPEQIRGHVLDARADVFSLGVVMHELLAGQPLFRGDNDAAILHGILTLPIPAPERLRADVPGALGAIVLRALQRDRDRRLPSTAALADAIVAVAEVEGVALEPTGVRDLVAELFPDDAARHAERVATAQHLYAHLSANEPREGTTRRTLISLRAGRLRRGLARVALVVGAISLAAFAAASTAHLRARRGLAVSPVILTASAEKFDLPARSNLPDMRTMPRQSSPELTGKPATASGWAAFTGACPVYISVRQGATPVCGDRAHRSAVATTRR